MSELIQTRASDLQVGDVLTGSGARVEESPTRGINTPMGCVDLLVSYPRHRDEYRRRTWPATTMMKVRRG